MHIMSINEDVTQWEHLECIENALVLEYIEGDILEVKDKTKELLQSFSMFYDRTVMLFFMGKISAFAFDQTMVAPSIIRRL